MSAASIVDLQVDFRAAEDAFEHADTDVEMEALAARQGVIIEVLASTPANSVTELLAKLRVLAVEEPFQTESTWDLMQSILKDAERLAGGKS